MNEDAIQTQPRDREQIDVREDQDIRYWTDELGISEVRLKELVGKLGPRVADVRRELAGS